MANSYGGRYGKSRRGIHSNVRVVTYRSNLYGMFQNQAPTSMNNGQAIDIVNMHSLQEGSWSADSAGYSIVNVGKTPYETGSQINGMARFKDTDKINHLLIAINGKLEEVDTATGAVTAIDSTGGYGAQVDFQQFNDAIYMVDGAMLKPRKWNGSAITDAPGWPVSDGANTYQSPKFIEKHQSRLVTMNFDGLPSHMLVSDLQDGESYTFIGAEANGAIAVEVGPGDGDEIIGARSIHIPASNETQLIIFKNSSTYALLGTTAQPDDLLNLHVLVEISDTYGAINNNCIVQVGTDIYALNDFGVTTLSAATQGGTIQPLGINSDAVIDVINRINSQAKQECWGIHLPSRREVWFFVPTGASAKCNEAIVYKYPSPGAQGQVAKWSRRTDIGGTFLMSHGVLIEKTFYVGSYNGIVGKMFASSKYGDTGIPWAYEWPEDDFGNDEQSKRLKGAAVLFLRLRSDQSITVTNSWRFGGNNDVTTQNLNVKTTTSGAKYGQARYGHQSKYGNRSEVKKTFEFLGDGVRLKTRLSGTTTDSGPELQGLNMELESLGLGNHWN